MSRCRQEQATGFDDFHEKKLAQGVDKVKKVGYASCREEKLGGTEVLPHPPLQLKGGSSSYRELHLKTHISYFKIANENLKRQ